MARGDQVVVEPRSIRISLAGPKDKEREARGQLEFLLYREFRDCPYFDRSGLAAKMARDITLATPYQVTKVRKEIVVNIVSVSLFYRNPPGPWKWWMRVRNGMNTIVPGSDARGEPELL
jgi:hypothetical protein